MHGIHGIKILTDVSSGNISRECETENDKAGSLY
jgi:hypothetical protein